MKFIVLTLFENMFYEFMNTSMIKRALEKEKASIKILDIRKFTKDKHHRTDFPPYGGGNGMIMSCEPLAGAIDEALEMLAKDQKEVKILYLSPRGKVLNDSMAHEIANSDKNYILLCGHYEGIDERIIEEYQIEEISIGNYVLTGGELASQVFMDCVIRLLPGVLADGSLTEESHTNGLLEYPQYTKPYEFRGKKVPDILLSANHQKIAEYRQQESIRITKKYRPDLLEKKDK